MLVHPTNPYKSGINSVVTSLSLFDCDGNEVKNYGSSVASGPEVKIQLPVERKEVNSSEESCKVAAGGCLGC